MGVGLNSETGSVAEGRKFGRGVPSQVHGRTLAVVTLTVARVRLVTGRLGPVGGWSLAVWGWSRSGPSQPDAHQREAGRRMDRAGHCRLPTSSKRAQDVEERSLTAEEQSRG